VAPQLFELKTGDLSQPIHAERNGVVAKLVDKQEPSADELAKSLDSTRDQMLDRKREEAFNLFLTTVSNDYKKKNLIQLNAKTAGPQVPGL
jgi:peptidyl-prolyl cis-trans isomerase D